MLIEFAQPKKLIAVLSLENRKEILNQYHVRIEKIIIKKKVEISTLDGDQFEKLFPQNK